MTFSQRLLKYLMGVSIGLVFVAMAFGPRAFSCNYLPNARVLEEATAKNFRYSNEAVEFLKAEGLDTTFVKKKLFAKSKVDFDKSDKDAVPCRTYIADYKDDTKDYQMVFEICKVTSKLISVTKK